MGVVIPTLNEEDALAALLARLLGAPDALDRPDRIVVSDGGSRDGTEEVARASAARARGAPPLLQWIVGVSGRGAQLGAGAAALDTNVLCFLHADCTPELGALRAVRAAFAEPDLAAGAFEQRIAAEGLFYRTVERCANGRVRALGWVYGDSGLCLRRELYTALGGFRALPLMEDIELSKRLRARARPRLIAGARLSVSARRWKREGALRATLRNWMLLVAYAAGAKPERLARFYAPHCGAEGRETS